MADGAIIMADGAIIMAGVIMVAMAAGMALATTAGAALGGDSLNRELSAGHNAAAVPVAAFALQERRAPRVQIPSR